MKPTNEQLKWLAVDLDDCVAGNSGFPDFKLQDPIPGAVEALQKLTDSGWKIQIHTARPSSDHYEIKTWLEKHNIPFKGIYTGKILAKYYIDDRALRFDGSWDDVVNNIK